MKRHLIILGIAVLLICVGLSGCNGIGNQFEGTWIGSVGMPAIFLDFRVTELTFTDNSVYMTWGSQGVSNTVSGTYETEGNKLLLTFPTGNSLTYTYKFEDGYLYLDGEKFTKLGR